MALLSKTGPSGVSNTGTYTTKNQFRKTKPSKHTSINIYKLRPKRNKVHLPNGVHFEKLWTFVGHTHLEILDQFNLGTTKLSSNKCLETIFVGASGVQHLKEEDQAHINIPFSR